MAEFRGTPQGVKYVWQARKPLRLPGGRFIQRGDTLTPTEEMIPGLRDLMVPVGDSLRMVDTTPPEASTPAVTLERDTRSRSRRDETAG